MCRVLPARTLVCLTMVDVEPSASTARVTNAGCPYPVHYRASQGEAVELSIEAYPLGVTPASTYHTLDVQLGAGDYLVLHSDGIAEAADASGEPFGFERTVEAVRQACAGGLPPEEVIAHLLAAARAFTGGVPQADDMTCVVVRRGC